MDFSVLKKICSQSPGRNGPPDVATEDDVAEVLDAILQGGAINTSKVQSILAQVPFMTAETALEAGVLLSAGDIRVFNNGIDYEEKGEVHRREQAASRSLESQWVAAGPPWTGGVLKYCVAPDVPLAVRLLFLRAIKDIKIELPCLQFQDVGWRSGTSRSPNTEMRCNTHPAVMLTSAKDGCFSYVGMDPFWSQWDLAQQLNIENPGCAWIGILVHELFHAFGMAHEHQRPDRDQMVLIHWDNIPPYLHDQFEIDPEAYTQEAYDYLSIMHYDEKAFAIDRRLPTITLPDGTIYEAMGQRSGMSMLDLRQLADMYNADEANVPGFCAPCSDTNVTCAYWASIGECKTSWYMQSYCRESCGTCHPAPCRDKSASCAYLASVGGCSQDPVWMQSYCRLSCATCLPD